MVSLGQEESPLEVIQEGAGLALGWDRVGGRVVRGKGLGPEHSREINLG